MHLLTIRGSFTQQELSRYKILANKEAFDLDLKNIADERKLDAIWFVKTLNINKGDVTCTHMGSKGYEFCKSSDNTYYGTTPLVINNGFYL